MSGRLRKLDRALRLVASRAIVVVVAIAMVLGVVRARTRFFYCPVAQLTFEAPPCSASRDGAEPGGADDEQTPAVRGADCCVEKWRAAAPPASTPNVEEATVARAQLVAVLPTAPVDVGPSPAKLPFAVPHAVRAGPPPPSASERRAELMVFHL